MIYPGKSLQNRLVLYVSLGLMIFSVIAGIFTYRYAYLRQLEISREYQNQLILTIQSQAEVAVFAINDQIGREILNGILTTPLFKGARIESVDFFNLEETADPNIDFSKGNVYPLFSPVDKKERIGSLIVVQNEKYIRKEATKVSFTQTLLMLLQLLMAAGLIVWVSRRVLSQPISDLANRVISIRPGSNSHLYISQTHVKDEIGLLSKSINSLIDAAESALAESLEARKSAEAATRAKSDFLANMSHEIRTPMNAVMGFADLVLKTELSSKQQDYIQKIQSASKSLLGVINDILDFSKIEAGKLEMESIDFRLDDIINNTANMISVKAEEKGIELVSTVDTNLPQSLVGDPLRLGQVLINLINNAVKFTSAGHIFIKVELVNENGDTVNKHPGEQCTVKFSISDTGIGMTLTQITNLFQAFTQADSSITRKFGGTGLGLTISRRLVQIMGGDMSVKSKPGEGSTFSFTAVFKISHKIEKNSFILPEALEGIKILVVDDNPMSREILTDQLISLGFETFAVDSGEKSLQELVRASATKPYDLVLIDWKMPGMDGIETSRRIRQNMWIAKIPRIIMVTAFGREEVMRRAQEAGINAFLIKPVLPSLMLNAIMGLFCKDLDLPKKTVRITSLDEQLETRIKNIKFARILLVEDNAINQQVATEILQGADLIVDVAENGLDALDKLEKSVYDLVLMDIQMPVMGGYEATRIIRKDDRFRQLPIIAMTAHAMTGAKESCLEAGMDGYVAKPIDQAELFSTLATWIKSRKTDKADDSLQDGDLPDKKSALDYKDNKLSDKNLNLQGKGPDIQNKRLDIQDKGLYIQDKGSDAQDDLNFGLIESLPGIDVKSALKRLNGNKKLYRQLLLDFARNYALVTEEIREHLDKQDLNSAERIAHTIKGVGGNLAADGIYNAARDLEYAIVEKTGNYDELLSGLNNVMRPLLASINRISEQSQNRKDKTDSPVDVQKVAPVMVELAGFLEGNDASALASSESLKKIMEYSAFKEKMMELENHVENFEFTSALSVLDNIANELNISLK
ncbi:MAG: response regulator [Desulfamplus sp.]|nr:response regulator [Desulfamplus sp.]